MVTGGLSYAESGVDIDIESKSVSALIRGLASIGPSRTPGEYGGLVKHTGGFSGLIEFGDNLLAMCTDGVGSKLMLAAELNNYETVASDCVAMNVNDLLCIGAEPLAFVDYIAAPRPDPTIWEALGRSLGRACQEARVTLCGGETASLPQMVKEIDMSGTALGWVPKDDQIDGGNVSVGDAIIGLGSSGVHSNGFSLVRKIIGRSKLKLDDKLPFTSNDEERAHGVAFRKNAGTNTSMTIGELLMNPTCIYVNPIFELLKSCRSQNVPCEYKNIHGIAHITGGGLSNFLRLKPGMGYMIDNPLPILAEFKWMQEIGLVSDYEMYRTFNMGMGMALVVDGDVAEKVADWIHERFKWVRIVGQVNDSGVAKHTPTGAVFDKY